MMVTRRSLELPADPQAQGPVPGSIHVHSHAAKEPVEPPMRRTFSKAGLQETWDFYQETQGPKTLELLPEDERQVLNVKFAISQSVVSTV